MKANIALLPGDGIGPEVTEAARRVLESVAALYGHEFEFGEGLIGGCAIDAQANPLPDDTLALCRKADAVFLGAVGGPKWSDPGAGVRPEQGLLRLREELGVYANLRPVRVHPALRGAAPIKSHLLQGVDLLVVRELTGGIYFGDKRREHDVAVDECVYRRSEIERIVVMACQLARERSGRLTSIDKANVLETSRLWRQVTESVVSEQFPDISLQHLLVDAAAMHLITRPADFDVIVTENMFGDILSDEASVLAGSLGLLPSASLSGHNPGLYEPIHGSAPDIAGKDLANPLGAISSAALLLRHSLQLDKEAEAVETAVDATISAGVLPADLAGGGHGVNTRAVTSTVIEYLQRARSPGVASGQTPAGRRHSHPVSR